MEKFRTYCTAVLCFLLSFLGSLALVDCISLSRQQAIVHEALIQRAQHFSHLVRSKGSTEGGLSLGIKAEQGCGRERKSLVVTEQSTGQVYTQVIVLDKLKTVIIHAATTWHSILPNASVFRKKTFGETIKIVLDGNNISKISQISARDSLVLRNAQKALSLKSAAMLCDV